MVTKKGSSEKYQGKNERRERKKEVTYSFFMKPSTMETFYFSSSVFVVVSMQSCFYKSGV